MENESGGFYVTRTEQRQLWEERLESFNNSGMTTKQWCQDQEISIHQFNYWKRKCSSAVPPTSPQFVFFNECQNVSHPFDKFNPNFEIFLLT
jgi:hypothetical protein